ncbi:hypothetical protein M5D96_013567, partial [Drosophila gunungcola]
MPQRKVMDLKLQVFGHFSAQTIFSKIMKGVTSQNM